MTMHMLALCQRPLRCTQVISTEPTFAIHHANASEQVSTTVLCPTSCSIFLGLASMLSSTWCFEHVHSFACARCITAQQSDYIL